jgi:hypothetical protein
MISRLNQRERILLGIVVAGLFVLLNVVLIRFVIGQRARLREQLAASRAKIEMLHKRESDRDLWARRDAWLTAKLPVLGDPDVANKALREFILDVAKNHTVTLEAPAPGVPTTQPNYTSLSVRLEAKAPWQSMFDFLFELQGPENFIAIENCELKVNREDKTQLRASLTVAKWFAPK